MQLKVLNGRIYKGSDAEIAVELFALCSTVVGYTDLKVSFYTDGAKSIERTQEEVTISGSTAIVTFAKEELDTISDGVLRYNVQYTSSGTQTVTEMQTGWYIKTPSSYTPSEYPSSREIEEVVKKDVEAATQGLLDGLATVNGQKLTDGGDIEIKVPTKTSELTNDSGFLTSHQDISGKINNEKGVEGIWSGTQEEYDAIGTYTDTVLYLIK